MKILAFIGTRPEAIKMAPVIQALKKSDSGITLKVVSTGQHKEMLKQVNDIFQIEPDIDLNVMVQNQSLSGLTAELFKDIDHVIQDEKPDWVIAQGDTTSVFVSSVVCFYHKVKFAHLEAGLRTHNIHSPFPEEFNRRAASIIADIHFTPTKECAHTLIKEGIPDHKILVTGNTVIDAIRDISTQNTELDFVLPDKNIVLVTAHRRENFDHMAEMFQSLAEIAKAYSDIHIVYPVHLNPKVHEKATKFLSGIDNVELIPPQDYRSFVTLMKRSAIILTDSGGIQEEAPSFGIPILIMRDTTERPEGVTAGVATLVGTKKENLKAAFSQFHSQNFKKHSISNPYGDGHAASKIEAFFSSVYRNKK